MVVISVLVLFIIYLIMKSIKKFDTFEFGKAKFKKNKSSQIDENIPQIEGIWIDRFKVNEDWHIAIMEIKMERGEYSIQGNEYNHDANKIGHWETLAVKRMGDHLDYLYHQTIYEKIPQESKGMTSLLFRGTDKEGNTTAYSGYFVDVFHGNVHEITHRHAYLDGRRITEEEIAIFKTAYGSNKLVKLLIENIKKSEAK